MIIRDHCSFNSLSRDHEVHEAQIWMWEYARFQLPLSGSQVLELGSDLFFNLDLSTPSLGITEPDSGIFRFSAAFCRGTSSHK